MKNSFRTALLACLCKAAEHLSTLLGKIWLQLQRWWELAEQRRRLALLDEYALHDLGLSRADALRESERPFWDDPLCPAEKSAAATSANCPSAIGRLPS